MGFLTIVNSTAAGQARVRECAARSSVSTALRKNVSISPLTAVFVWHLLQRSRVVHTVALTSAHGRVQGANNAGCDEIEGVADYFGAAVSRACPNVGQRPRRGAERQWRRGDRADDYRGDGAEACRGH